MLNKFTQRKSEGFETIFKGISLIFQAVMIGVTAWQLAIMSGQLAEMASSSKQTDAIIEQNKKLADAAEQTLFLSQRAWVAPLGTKIVGQLELNKGLDTLTQYQNIGKQPALDFDYQQELKISDSDINSLSSKLIISRHQDQCLTESKKNEANIVYPTSGLSVYSFVYSFHDLKVNENILNGNNILIINTCFSYQTIGKFVNSSACYFYKASFSKLENLSICPSGNQTITKNS